MSEEEKQAIDTLQNCIADYVIGDFCVGQYCPQEDVCKNDDCPFEKAIDTVINLIEKQQKEIEEAKLNYKELKDYIKNNCIEKSCHDKLLNAYDKALKVIDNMAKMIWEHTSYKNIEDVKDKFYKEVEKC